MTVHILTLGIPEAQEGDELILFHREQFSSLCFRLF